MTFADNADDFVPVYRSRPGGADMKPATAAQAALVAPGIWVSEGLSNSYLLTTDEGRIIVNTGMGFEGPVHRANFDAVDDSPVRYVILTQGHVDHVGGLDTVRDPDSVVVAQANWSHWRDDNARLIAYRASRSAFAFGSTLAEGVGAIQRRFGALAPQSVATADVVVDYSMTLTVGGRTIELIATPGGETTDSMVVWLPDEKICLCGNVFGALFGHIPNLVTMRGDRYRDALQVIESIDRVRALRPEMLLTGHFAPISGADRVAAELTRLRDAVQYLHDETVAGMNAGKDVHTLMREIALPVELEVGEGYGKVAWDVRAIWENYSGWFHHESTTELYDVPRRAVDADLVDLAGGDALATRAEQYLADGDELRAIHLAEIVVNADPEHDKARDILAGAHRNLLARSENFWESAWLTKELEKLA